ncbi:MAG: LOG family protein [Anaerolineaceae bacterium]
MTLVAVFGSSAPKPGSTAYAQAEALGNALGSRGFSVMTGGYCGIMEAVSKGTVETGGQTIGVTCEDIDRYRPGGANPWVQIVIPTENLNKRLEILTRQPDAFIALPGGFGTLCEIALALNLMAVDSIEAKPLILIGDVWQNICQAFIESNAEFVPQAHTELLHFVNDNNEALQLLKQLLDKRD